MDEIRREDIDRFASALERSAEASEKLLELAEKEQVAMLEPGPPVCPNCGAFDPKVTVLEGGGSGEISEYVLMVETHCCNRMIFGLAVGWDLFVDREMVVDLVKRRRVGDERSI